MDSMFPTVAQWHAISFALQNDFLYKMVWLMFVQCHCVELFDWFVVFSCVFCYIYFFCWIGMDRMDSVVGFKKSRYS